MKHVLIIQTVACASGLAGIYLANNAGYRWVLASLVVLASLAVVFSAWSERKSRDFVERALESLILSSKPNEYSRKRVVSAINHAAIGKEMPQSHVMVYDDGSMKIRFYDADQTPAGSIIVDDERISRMAIMPDAELKSMAEAIFKSRARDTKRTRDGLVEDISTAGRFTLWENQIKTPEWCVWVNDELISIPTAPPDQSCAPDDRVTFGADTFDNLMISSDFELHSLVESRVREKIEA